jgi:hypothetical protein
MKYRFCIIALPILLTVGPAFAGPPLRTDDTGTPGNKNWEINVGFTLDKRHTETTYQVPVLDLNYGVGNNIQLNYSVPWLVRHEQETGTKNGVGNSGVGVKWRFLDQERSGVNMSLYPQLEFNNSTSSADRRLVDDGSNLLLPIQVSRKFGPVWINGELGYTLREHHEDEWLYGLSSGYEIREDLTLLGELHGNSTKNFNTNELLFNIGTQWDFSKKFGLLASAGSTLFSNVNDKLSLQLYLGLQMRL